MSNLHEGHRERMDRKSEVTGLHNMPEHEVLEKILFAVIPRGNTNEIAGELCRRFGGIGGVFAAEIDELMEVKGVGRRVAYFLYELPDILGIVERSLRFSDKTIRNGQDAQDYVKTFFYGKVTEQVYMISLNKAGHIIKHDKIGEGIIDEVPIYARQVAKIAMQNKAYSVIIAHNHPGGTLTPSRADVQCTEHIALALSTLGIKFYDSIIVAKGETASIFDSDICGIKR